MVAKTVAVIGVLLSILFRPEYTWSVGQPDSSTPSSSQDTTDPKPFVLAIALSGGGFRSAAFSYGVLHELSMVNYCIHEFTDRDKTKLMLTKLDYTDDNGVFLCDDVYGKPFFQGNVLNDLDYISAISGGSFTAAYYSLKGNLKAFISTFPSVLEKNIENRLYRFLAWPFDPYFFPFRLIVSALDVPWSLLTSPLSLIGYPAPSLTGLLLLKGISGIVSIDDAITIYNRHILGGRVSTVTFGDIKEPWRSKLLIHATDLARERIFTFDKRTIECLLAQRNDDFDEVKGYKHFKRFPLAAAMGASAAEPGMFQPYEFTIRNGSLSLPSFCHSTYDNAIKGTTLSLVDGGIYENLGLEGLMPYLFEKKRSAPQKRMLVIVVNAEVDSSYNNNPGLIDVLDQSFDTLMGQRTGLSVSLYKEFFQAFGIDVIELSFNTLLNSRRIRQLMLRDIKENRDTMFSEFQLKGSLKDKPILDFVVPGGRFANAKVNNVSKGCETIPPGLRREDSILKYRGETVRTNKDLHSIMKKHLHKSDAFEVAAKRGTCEIIFSIPSRSDDPLRMATLSRLATSSKEDHELVKALAELKTNFALTLSERDTLIKAGRRVVREKIGEEGGHEFLRIIDSMLDSDFRDDCANVISPREEYCWPPDWDETLFQRPLRSRLEEMWRVVKSTYRVPAVTLPSTP